MRNEAFDSWGTPILPWIEILKYEHKTLEKKPFQSPDSIQVSLTHLNPTPELDAWFTDCDTEDSS